MCTAVSLLVTVLVEASLLIFPSINWGPFGGAFGFVCIALALLVGLVANTIAGQFAVSRGESWGSGIALMGLAVWLATIALWFVKHPVQW